MCYKDEQQVKIGKKVEDRLKDMPTFIGRFFKSKNSLKSKGSHLQYVTVFKEFFNYLIAENIIHKSSIREIDEEDIGLLKATDIGIYINYLQETFAPGTCKTKLNCIKSLFSFFVQDDILIKNIATDLYVEEDDRKEIKMATLEGVDELISNMEDRIRDEYTCIRNIAITKLLIGSGVRRSELIGLDLENLIFEDRNRPFITIMEKGNVRGKVRKIAINTPARDAVEAYLKIRHRKKIYDIDAVFLGENGYRLSTGYIYKFIKQYSDGKLNPHMLRKGAGSLIYNRTGDIQLAASQLGHGSTSTTIKWYVKPDDDRMRDGLNF